ncbi:MAG: (Na+)-NQR maturation NqrM [Pseudomonadota bacterium]
MSTFALAFGFLLLLMVGMAIGVILKGRTIKGSCGGLNAVAGADRCVVCKKEIDPESPLRERLNCPRARQMSDRMGED